MVNRNGHEPEESPTIAPGKTRVGIGKTLGLEQESGIGYHFNAIESMAHMSAEASEWMCMTRVTEREIQIQALRYARRHRARYGNSRLDLVDYYKALLRVSRDGMGRSEIESMYKAEVNRETDRQSGWTRTFGARQNPERLAG